MKKNEKLSETKARRIRGRKIKSRIKTRTAARTRRTSRGIEQNERTAGKNELGRSKEIRSRKKRQFR